MPGFADAANSFFDALQNVMPKLMEAATNAIATLLSDRGNAAWAAITMGLQQSDFNFVTRTPPGMSYNFGGVSDFLRQYDRLYYGVGIFALTMLGLASGCRAFFAWGWEIPEGLARVILATLLGTSAPRIYQVTIDLNNRLCDAIIGAQLPSLNATGAGAVDTLTMAIVIVIWIVLGIRVLVRMGYRLLYFDVLLIVGPVALAAWAIPGGEPYARQWTRSYVGLLLGQILVAICLRLAGGLGGVLGGSIAGLALGIGALLLAYDLATMYAEIRGGGLSNIARGATRVILRR